MVGERLQRAQHTRRGPCTDLNLAARPANDTAHRHPDKGTGNRTAKFEKAPVPNASGWYMRWVSLQRDVTHRTLAASIIGTATPFEELLDGACSELILFTGAPGATGRWPMFCCPRSRNDSQPPAIGSGYTVIARAFMGNRRMRTSCKPLDVKARSGQDGLDLAQSMGEELAGVITDVRMLGMSRIAWYAHCVKHAQLYQCCL